jgi:hypothetical protein
MRRAASAEHTAHQSTPREAPNAAAPRGALAMAERVLV